MGFGAWAAGSAAFLAVSVSRAIQAQVAGEPQFFLVMRHLLTDKLCLLSLANGAALLGVGAWRAAQRLFLGRLRDEELEALWESAAAAFGEVCYSLVIFGEGLSDRNVCLCAALLAAKAFHRVAALRARRAEQEAQQHGQLLQPPPPPPLTPPSREQGGEQQHEQQREQEHEAAQGQQEQGQGQGRAPPEQPPWQPPLRLLLFLALLLFADGLAALVGAASLRRFGPSPVMLFGFEFALLAVQAAAGLARVGLPALTGGRRVAGFALEAGADCASLLLYLGYSAALLAHFGLPLHLLHQMWGAATQLAGQARSWLRYRRLRRALRRACPAASAAALAAGDGMCVVCRGAMEVAAAGGDGGGGGGGGGGGTAAAEEDEVPRVLPGCGHIVHTGCLRLWLQRQQNCPICRHPVRVQEEEDVGQAEGAGVLAPVAERARVGGADENARPALPPLPSPPLLPPPPLPPPVPGARRGAPAAKQLQAQVDALRAQLQLCDEQQQRAGQQQSLVAAAAAVRASIEQQIAVVEGMAAAEAEAAAAVSAAGCALGTKSKRA